MDKASPLDTYHGSWGWEWPGVGGWGLLCLVRTRLCGQVSDEGFDLRKGLFSASYQPSLLIGLSASCACLGLDCL